MPTKKERNKLLVEKVYESLDHMKKGDPQATIVKGSLRRHSDTIASCILQYSSGNWKLKYYNLGGGGTWFDFTPSYADIFGFQGLIDELKKVEQHNLEIDLEPL